MSNFSTCKLFYVPAVFCNCSFLRMSVRYYVKWIKAWLPAFRHWPEGGLFSESFSLWVKSPRNMLNYDPQHYPTKEKMHRVVSWHLFLGDLSQSEKTFWDYATFTWCHFRYLKIGLLALTWKSSAISGCKPAAFLTKTSIRSMTSLPLMGCCFEMPITKRWHNVSCNKGISEVAFT